MQFSRSAIRAALALTASAVTVFPVLGQASPASAEPNPCAGRTDGGSGGDYNDGTNFPYTIRLIYGTWWNCSGGTGADRVRLVVATDTDGPCITVPYGTTDSTVLRRAYLRFPPYYDGWKRC